MSSNKAFLKLSEEFGKELSESIQNQVRKEVGNNMNLGPAPSSISVPSIPAIPKLDEDSCTVRELKMLRNQEYDTTRLQAYREEMKEYCKAISHLDITIHTLGCLKSCLADFRNANKGRYFLIRKEGMHTVESEAILNNVVRMMKKSGWDVSRTATPFALQTPEVFHFCIQLNS